MTAQGTTGQPPRASEPVGQTRRLYRSRQNRTLAGVCGGIAEYYGSDPNAVRLVTLVIGLFTGIIPMVVLYLVAALVIPEDGSPESIQGVAATPGQASLVLGAILVLVGIAGISNVWLNLDWEYIWPIALVGLGVALVLGTLRPRR